MNLRSLYSSLCALLILVLLSATCIVGQQITGSLTGLVSDNTGARIPHAGVTLTNEASGDTRRSRTNSEGYFSIVGIPPGSYSVRFEASGFTSKKVNSVVFTAGDARTLGEVTLGVGTTSENVVVSAAVTSLSTVDSGEKSVVLSQKQFDEIPAVGASALEYMKLLPGMADVSSSLENRPGMNGEVVGIDGSGLKGNQSGMGWFSANGQPRRAMVISMDGEIVDDPGCNCSTPVNPNPAMISELKVQQANFSAENARGPVVVSSVTKAGSNTFHGSLFFSARDYALESNDAEYNTTGLARPQNHYFYPGGVLGGPVLLPGTKFNRNRDKLFFFAGYQYFAQRIDSGILRAIVPTDAMRNGDFSNQALLNAFGKVNQNASRSISSLFPGSVIPQSRLDPGMAALMKLLPEPNVDPSGVGNGYNWATTRQADQNMKQILVRTDYSISDYTKLFFRYNHQDMLQPVTVQWWCCASGAVPTPSSISNPTRSDAFAANFTKVLSPTFTDETVLGYTYQNEPAYYDDPSAVQRSTVGYPYNGIYGVDSFIPSFSAGTGIGAIRLQGLNPTWLNQKQQASITNNATKVIANHTVKFGFYWAKIINKQTDGGLQLAQVAFSTGHTTTTGNVLADMALGNGSSYSESTGPVIQNQGWQEASGFLQDSWKIRSNLTLEYGLRIQHMTPWTARNQFGTATWIQSEYSPTAPASALPGVDWHRNNSSISLAGWGDQAVYLAPRVGVAWDIFGTGRTVLRGGFGTFVSHDYAIDAGAMNLPAGQRSITVSPDVSLPAMDSVAPAGSLVFGGIAVNPNDHYQPTTKSWSVTLSNRLVPSVFWEVSYVGSKNTHLLTPSGVTNINQVPLGAMINNPTANADSYRPMTQYSSLQVPTHDAYSNYNALQTMLTKQLGNLSLTVSYSFSKALGIVDSTMDNLNLANNYGVLGLDRTNLFSISYFYKIPNLVHGGSAPLRAMVNGWQIAGRVQNTSGVNLQQMSTNFGLTDYLSGTNRTMLNTDVTGTNAITLMPVLTCDPRKNLGSNQFINGSCFAPPVPGVNGALGTNGSVIMPYLKGPSFFDTDLSLSKIFTFKDRQELEFSASGFNFLNHPNRSFVAGDPNLQLQFSGQGQLSNPNFGYADYVVGRRIIELAVKYRF